MLQFTSLAQSTPEKRDNATRKKDFKEIYKEICRLKNKIHEYLTK